ncbi:putative isoflavone-7-O-beta-glucoside 6''-O-malonyltransferase [Lupinus albus]|uniref:Putative isoflavone-7-O-beta-glucoside 6''-O-malonyltransferase n=1 Tax=Lupinus albus TaxID=3870 RepID=A0A6A4PTP2_LUPAL|nr:putative isoflavone-7-O-beta-glucoside 6''-O-malonyltransferase [Lupinus albus]
MAFPIIIHENLLVSPQSSTQLSLPLTFFDMFWLRFHPVERIFFYSLPNHSHSHDSSFFFNNIVPNLKTSLSLTLQTFLPLAGNIIWPSHSPKPIIQYNPGDAVSFVIAESSVDFNHVLQNSPCDASESRFLLPNLDSSDSTASVISMQVTLFPKKGFSIGITAHHAVVDGKSSTMFIKAWANLCRSSVQECPSFSLNPELEPFLDRGVIKDPTQLDLLLADNWTKDPNDNTKKKRSLEILSFVFKPKVENSVRATFNISFKDLDKLKKRVLSKWDEVNDDEVVVNNSYSKPDTLSSFVVICAYVSTCMAKAIQEDEKNEEKKFAFGFAVDCRSRLEPKVGENYFGNCVNLHVVDAKPEDFTKEDGFVIVAKKIVSKIKNLDKDGVLEGVDTLSSKHESRVRLGVELIGVAGSSRFGVYENDFGWGKPSKVEITSVDRGLTIAISETKDENENAGLQVGLVLKNNVMDIFTNLFHQGL